MIRSAVPDDRVPGRARELAARFAALEPVAAVAIGGSRSSGAADDRSDIDLYIFTTRDLPHDERVRIITDSGIAGRPDLGLPYWGGVYVWQDAASGVMLDCMFFGAAWIEEQVAAAMVEHRPSLGYSTCFCRTVAQSVPLFDRAGWYAALQARSRLPYPDALRRAIVAHNHPVLRTIHTSYLHQVERALWRGDPVSVNHRVAALLASYFDVVFALNGVLHPGEKRLLEFAARECALLPVNMSADVRHVLAAGSDMDGRVVGHLHRMLDRLDTLIAGTDLRPLLPAEPPAAP